jgi:cytochrome c oxidase cbb3-type subunit 1
MIRAIGGLLFVLGALIMAYNLWMTVKVGEKAEVDAADPSLVPAE